MITVRFISDDLKRLEDPHLLLQAEAGMIERAVEILQPLAAAEAPSRTGKGRSMILGKVDNRSGHPVGIVHAGKAFWLRILHSGTYKKPSGYDINVFRFKKTRRGNVSPAARRAARALGPGRARGAIRALRFQIGGRILFRGGVRHPGFKGDPFFERAALRGESSVGVAGEAVVQAALDRVNG